MIKISSFIVGLLISSTLFANQHFTIFNSSADPVSVKATQEFSGQLWCDDHRKTREKPCIISPQSSKEFELTTEYSNSNLIYVISREESPTTMLCVYGLDTKLFGYAELLYSYEGAACDNNSFDVSVTF